MLFLEENEAGVPFRVRRIDTTTKNILEPTLGAGTKGHVTMTKDHETMMRDHVTLGIKVVITEIIGKRTKIGIEAIIITWQIQNGVGIHTDMM